MQVNDVDCSSSAVDRKEKVEAVLIRLQSLRSQVSELRVQCEALKKRQSEKPKAGFDLKCDECGKIIAQGQEVALKDSFGKVKSYYHKDCFKAIWVSQTWKFDYSQPGFLRMSRKDQ